jgi:hypothetical protein
VSARTLLVLAALLGATPAFALQLEAPSGNVVSPALLDRLASPRILSGDLDWPYEDRGEGLAFTLRSSPLSWMAPTGSESSVRAASAWSRLGAAFTLGGPTQTDDQIVESRHHRVSDHVTGELKLPCFGVPPDASDARAGAGAPVALGAELAADIYSTGFGRDLYMAALAAESTRGFPWTANLGFRAEEKVHGERNDELKLGVGSGTSWDRRLWIVRGVDASASGAVLMRNRSREDVWLANTRVDLPLAGHTRLTGAVTWSNSPERIRVPVVRGRLSLAYEFARAR